MQLFDKLLWMPPRVEEEYQNADNFLASFAVGDGEGSDLLAGYDMWQTHPVLGNLFDIPFDGSNMQNSMVDASGFTPCFNGDAQYMAG